MFATKLAKQLNQSYGTDAIFVSFLLILKTLKATFLCLYS